MKLDYTVLKRQADGDLALTDEVEAGETLIEPMDWPRSTHPGTLRAAYLANSRRFPRSADL